MPDDLRCARPLHSHPAVTGICSPFINDYKYTAAVGTSLEDATFVLHLTARQIPHRYPNIRFIVPHLGGPIPMLLNRLGKQGQRDHPGLAEAPSVIARGSITTPCAMVRRRPSCAPTKLLARATW